MPVLLSRRYQPPFYPVHHKSWPVRLFTVVERMIKGWLFGCRMCGNCILPESAFICPMTCPKGLRNGPCRGSTSSRCSVDPACDCTWFRICQKAEQQGNLETLLEVNAPLDCRRIGCETLLSTYQFWRKRDQGPHLRDLILNRPRFNSEWGQFRYELRQPDWWQGDSQYHPPKYTEPVSALEATLRQGRFAVSAEVVPPMDLTGNRIGQVAGRLRNFVHTGNFTDNPLGVPRMSGLSCAIQSLENKLEPVLQLQTRHRNRREFEAEAVGAAAVGVRNILCLADDFGRLGPGPAPRPELNDLDTAQALWILRRLRDEGINVDGMPVEHRPRYFLGAMASPYAALPKYEAIITEKKINAGAQFLQTMPVFDLNRFGEWLEAVDKRNLLGKVYLMPTVALFKHPRHARFMANEVPGVYIPLPVMVRLENAADSGEESIQIALGLIDQLKGMSGVFGLHILAPGLEEVVPRLVKESGLKDARAQPARGAGAFSKNGKNKPLTNLTMSLNDSLGTESYRDLYP
jgi:methylenetetrahydrofolate reductase (NADPH)